MEAVPDGPGRSALASSQDPTSCMCNISIERNKSSNKSARRLSPGRLNSQFGQYELSFCTPNGCHALLANTQSISCKASRGQCSKFWLRLTERL